jgi:hypothetical protein
MIAALPPMSPPLGAEVPTGFRRRSDSASGPALSAAECLPIFFRFHEGMANVMNDMSTLLEQQIPALVGLMMSLFYAFVLEPLMPWGTIIKGSSYALVVWFINALIVLPATGEGFAGSENLSLILWYAAAHTLFFMLLAYGFALHHVPLVFVLIRKLNSRGEVCDDVNLDPPYRS